MMLKWWARSDHRDLHGRHVEAAHAVGLAYLWMRSKSAMATVASRAEAWTLNLKSAAP